MLVLGTYDVVNCDQHVEKHMLDVNTITKPQKSKKPPDAPQCLRESNALAAMLTSLERPPRLVQACGRAGHIATQ